MAIQGSSLETRSLTLMKAVPLNMHRVPFPPCSPFRQTSATPSLASKGSSYGFMPSQSRRTARARIQSSASVHAQSALPSPPESPASAPLPSRPSWGFPTSELAPAEFLPGGEANASLTPPSPSSPFHSASFPEALTVPTASRGRPEGSWAVHQAGRKGAPSPAPHRLALRPASAPLQRRSRAIH